MLKQKQCSPATRAGRWEELLGIQRDPVRGLCFPRALTWRAGAVAPGMRKIRDENQMSEEAWIPFPTPLHPASSCPLTEPSLGLPWVLNEESDLDSPEVGVCPGFSAKGPGCTEPIQP